MSFILIYIMHSSVPKNLMHCENIPGTNFWEGQLQASETYIQPNTVPGGLSEEFSPWAH